MVVRLGTQDDAESINIMRHALQLGIELTELPCRDLATRNPLAASLENCPPRGGCFDFHEMWADLGCRQPQRGERLRG
jgi:hypothetical protein